ncbi:MAG: hypothetical protein A2X82_07465 [Geobacteraceae bacterium GWC2_55_20]|nr:MAG: hypothetical protein A2X82_07465 [Geobacteraceae bacterium GWC2_55_20]OGU18685.1 MAG: hypothetical protein A2X85_01175 [Geobacteraceae bacterium GWF2_54_21]HCE67604.1 hypothetical protein [Geobacter sp.]
MTTHNKNNSGFGLRSLLRLTVFMLVMAFTCPTFAASPDVVISQVYGGGGNTGATYKNDFIELFNRGSSPVSLNGWSVQYASATGTTWAVTSLTNVTLQPGQYYLVKEAAGTGGTVYLPTPDATGSIAMSSTAGKVALVTATVPLSGACPGGFKDLVGYGSTVNCSEGSAPTPAPSNTTAVLRAGNGCTDTDVNSNDFSAGTPFPRNTASTANACTSPSTFLLTTTIAGNGSGSVTGVTNPYAAGSNATITAVPGSNSAFTSWSDCSTSTMLTINVTMDSSKTCTANFTATAAGLTIFHVNDTHARLTPHKMIPPAHSPVNGPFEEVGGAAHLAGKMLQLTAVNPDSLVLDAGDMSEGNPIGDMTFDGCAAGGTPGMSSNCGMTTFYGMLSDKLKLVPGRNGRGLDAVVVGNHDVRDASYIGNLQALQATGVPVVSVNVRNKTTHLPYFAPYTVTTVNGKKVGVIGYTNPSGDIGPSLTDTLEVVSCTWTGSTVCNISDYVTQLRNEPNNVDLVVLLSHLGHSALVDPAAPVLADTGTPKLPEVVVTGHWHTIADTAWQPDSLNYKTIFSEAGSYMKYIGELQVTDAGRFFANSNHLIRNADITPDPDVQSYVNGLIALYDSANPGRPVNEVIGYTADNLLLDNEMKWWSTNEYPWSGNNTAGQWISDAVQWKAEQIFGSCDLAIETGGGVRADIPAGPVTYLQIYETFPWSDDFFYRINMTGQEIVNFLKETNLNAGFSRQLDVTAYDGVPTEVRFNGQPIELNRTYTVAINNYLYANPPSGWTWSDTAPLTSTILCRDGIVDYMRQFTANNPYTVGGPRYHMNTEFSGGYRAVVTMLTDSQANPTYETAFIRFLSATPETLARRGTPQVPADLVNEDGSINPAHHLAENELYRSYLGFKAGALKHGDIIETWGKGSFYGGNPEFVDQEGIRSDGVEFKIIGFDPSLAKPAFMTSINAFWNDHNKNRYVQFLAKKAGTSSVTDQNGQTITLMDVTGYANIASIPGNIGDTLLISGVLSMESYGMRFRCDGVVLTALTLPAASPLSSRIAPAPAGSSASPLTLTATASTTNNSFTLAPVADAQVASAYPTINYGTGANLYLQSSTSGYGNERGWLKFDLSGLPADATIASANLQLYNWKVAGESMPASIHPVNDDSWTETGITWSSQPVFDPSPLDTKTLVAGTPNLWYGWDVTPFVQNQWSGDKMVSLLVKPVTENSTAIPAPSYGFDAKEYGSNGPMLQVTLQAPPVTVAEVAFFYRYSADNSNWGAWTQYGFPATTVPYTTSFTYPQGYGYYEFYSRAMDSSNNVEPEPAAAHTATHYTAAPPYTSEAIVTLGGLTATYDGTAKAPAVTTVPPGLSYSITYNGNSSVPFAVGAYTVVATVTQAGYTGSATDTFRIIKATATVNLGNWSFTYNGGQKQVTASTIPPGLPVIITYGGSTIPPVNAGTYPLVATVDSPTYQGTATGTLVITPAAATVTPGVLDFTYDGNPKSVTVTTEPLGLSYSITYNGSSDPPTEAGTYAVLATVTDPNYTGNSTATMTIVDTTAVPVPALGPLGILVAVAGLSGVMLRRRKSLI